MCSLPVLPQRFTTPGAHFDFRRFHSYVRRSQSIQENPATPTSQGSLRIPDLGGRMKIIEFFTHTVPQAELVESEHDPHFFGASVRDPKPRAGQLGFQLTVY